MENLRYRWLDRETYEGYLLCFTYKTGSYYRVNATQWGMNLEKCDFPQAIEKKFTDHLFSEWLENPIALGVFEGETLAGVIEGSMEVWHDVFRISNLLVMGPYRRCGLGRELMRRMLEHARKIPNCRGAILETQSCNYPAISFYCEQGFQLSRIDLREYSNDDIQRKEVRLDFFLPFQDAEKEG